MRIANNIMAMNAHRQLTVNQSQIAKSIEKLSSGLRINRAGDDAAGLAISEKMRGQIRGLKMASKNAQDAISLIQTAEGALQESHAILQRMRELAVQSASDTNTDADRAELQKEIDQLARELTRIAETTEFNTQNLLGGRFEGTFHIGANEGQNITLEIGDMSARALGVAGDAGLKLDISVTVSEDIGTTHLEDGETYQVEELAEAVDIDGTSYNYVLRNADDEIVGVSTDGKTYKLVAFEQTLTTDPGQVSLDDAVSVDFADPVRSGEVTVTSVNEGSGFTLSATATVAVKGLAVGEYRVVDQTHHLISTGEYGLVDNRTGQLVAISSDGGQSWTDLESNALFNVSNALNTAGTIVTVGDGGGINVSSQAAADKAISIINTAIETVSAERSKLGALQNRLEHTIANLGVSAENLQAAESRIRDVDMAAEMMTFTKYQILQQASTAMLAQANLAPQSVLQLLG